MNILAGCTIISNFQLYGKHFLKRRKDLGIQTCFYIDGTLTEYFESYAGFEVSSIDPATRRQAMELEQDGYDAADVVVAFSKLTAQTLQQRYRVPAAKTFVVLPGANLSDEVVDSLVYPAQPDVRESFILGFVGLYPIRKGLDRLVEALRILRSQGLNVRLRVIGKCPPELLNVDGLDYLGVINKRTHLSEFIAAISSVHLGCLLSRSELAGISMLEFLRTGVPILGTRVGGATDILEAAGGIMVDPSIDADDLACVIAKLYKDPDAYFRLKCAAEANRQWASWKRAAYELDEITPGVSV